jgi:hypothetical protein
MGELLVAPLLAPVTCRVGKIVSSAVTQLELATT